MRRPNPSPCLLLAALLATAANAAEPSPLFDRADLTLAGRQASLDTTARIDAIEGVALGTVLDLEDDLGLEEDETGVTLEAGLHLGRRHRLEAAYAASEREASETLFREVRIGDVVFPVSASLDLGLDVETLTAGYRFYPLAGESTAFGIGVGARIYSIDFTASVAALGLAESAEESGPLPFVDVELRTLVADRWRLVARVGAFDVEIDELEGSQLLGRLSLEYLARGPFALGAAVDLGQIDVTSDSGSFRGTVESDTLAVSLFLRLRS